MNIRFEYLYRDAGNFKNWGQVIFSNPSNIGAEEVATKAVALLIDSTWFVATQADVPDLHFNDYNDQLDHGWHEVHGFELTDELPNDRESRTIEEFLESLRSASAH